MKRGGGASRAAGGQGRKETKEKMDGMSLAPGRTARPRRSRRQVGVWDSGKEAIPACVWCNTAGLRYLLGCCSQALIQSTAITSSHSPYTSATREERAACLSRDPKVKKGSKGDHRWRRGRSRFPNPEGGLIALSRPSSVTA